MSTGVNSTYSPPVKQDSGENNGPVVTAVTLWFLVISSVFIVLRCVSRIGVVKKWSWDDTFIVFAWVCVLPREKALLNRDHLKKLIWS